MKVGRPEIIKGIVLKKLEDAFSNGATDREACFLAGISNQTLYDHQERHPEFIERKETLKEMIKFQARLKIKQAIDKEKKPETSKWYLERRDKEFKPKSDLTSDDKEIKPVLVKFLNGKQDKDN
jgi:hypothetical protein